ncbi:formate--tetrahydrofolate ligase [Pediococcus acidilactici]|uniref:formate--tetrahydrofolate ligase n=1 Tax=Pediococcus acidilactici TaxID=1254 RepID=UPI001323B949|nr:formate--tetrahydrofolate ligase [Pediococcus acidilactici]KAF0333376.1 formate--tetrahydrofolate ligase [Pediococcus acidilactici]KAF0346951.1 formate--tetrahydrofolate ligase [Pediococcus acidilactici]KAF0392701.1 formate--tetrahydrofolate ligase [Pediococcus acidilactici]KAF0396032.1 formate--tetrahydrofolate ligase [Pediococcus acidilactici]KAF0408544.1 formate--tetrahydrofolate ligase [Pediococcus acidilactici]
MNDIEISQNAEMLPIQEIAQQAGFNEKNVEPYGRYKAKIDIFAEDEEAAQLGKLVLVTSINPTPAGEGKSTVTVGLGDALNEMTGSAMVALREPSQGPVMGMKGGATGGGYSQVVPMDEINLHFTGDMHALTAANNTLAALIDNHIQQGNQLNIDPRTIVWRRCLDINDRALRNIVIGMGGRFSGVPREDHFDITVASELMAILCLAESLTDLKKRINRILIAKNYVGEPIFVRDLKVGGAITALLKDALKPNLVQTLGHTPALIHGGPFANIAHGCNSVLATKTALKHADYTITEAGFGADLGAEKFLDIKTPVLGKEPDAIVIVATVRALKYNGGAKLADLQNEDLVALEKGFVNLQRHIKNMQRYQVPVVVSINHFTSDTDQEIAKLKQLVEQTGVQAVVTDAWAKGGAGCKELAQAVITATDTNSDVTMQPLYDVAAPIQDKVKAIVQKMYGGAEVQYSATALKKIKECEQNGWDKLPICMAKTQYSFTDDPKQLGAPTGFTMHVNDINIRLGAGFLVVLTGKVLTMPGLPKQPAALNIDVNDKGEITGLF